MVNVYSPSHLWPCYTFSTYMYGTKVSDNVFCAFVSDNYKVCDNDYFDQVTKGIHENVVCHGSIKGGIPLYGESIDNATTKWNVVLKDRYPGKRILYGSFNISDRGGVNDENPSSIYFCRTANMNGIHFSILVYTCQDGRISPTKGTWWYSQLRAAVAYTVHGDFLYTVDFPSPSRFYKPLDVEWSAFAGKSSGDVINRWTSALNEAVKASTLKETRTSKYPFCVKVPIDIGSYDSGRLPNVLNYFRFKEPSFVRKPWMKPEEYAFRHLQQAAFMKAIEGVKALNQNMVSTLVEVIQFLLQVKSGKFKVSECIPDSLYSAWLQYRYVYNTTKADIQEAIEFVEYTGVMDFSNDVVFRGSETDDYGRTCRAKVTLRSKFLEGISKAWKTLRDYGVQPNFYLVWDMTPFSFIVDWFIPVGDLCDLIDRYNHITDTFECAGVVYSLSYGDNFGETMALDLDLYTRWSEKFFPPVEFCYLYDGGGASDKTILFRCIDAVSLILGRK